MKFVHIADMHFDKPFNSLNRIENLGEKRRLEQREVFRKVINYIKENDIPYFFISGDLYEQEYVKLSTIEFINNLFREIPNTKIFISPGNHDPYLRNSYYADYAWNSNVHIFGGEIEKISYSDMNIYGYGFTDFYSGRVPISPIVLEEDKINILIIHASVDASEGEEMSYNPITIKELRDKKFDYIALGHIHKRSNLEGSNIIYPGSTVAGGFDELGSHGMIVGQIEKEELKLEFIPLDEREFVEKEINVEDAFSFEELVEKIKEEDWESNKLYKLILVGKRNFPIEKEKVLELIEIPNMIKIKDRTKIKYDLEKLENEESLKGIFIKNMKKKLAENPEQAELIEKAIEIGMEALEG